MDKIGYSKKRIWILFDSLVAYILLVAFLGFSGFLPGSRAATSHAAGGRPDVFFWPDGPFSFLFRPLP
jgi:hypothetical protein